MKRGLIAVGLLGAMVAGCSNIGPKTVPKDRFDYNTAVADSWKEQTLLNIVKLRYADMPLFMEVASIVSGYTLERSVSVGGTVVEGGSNPNALNLGAAGKYTDRPTITYAPITGAQFTKNFMTPVPPAAVLFLLQSGWPAELVLPIAVDAINGLRAQKSAGQRARLGDSDFYRAVELFRTIQRSGAIGLRVMGTHEGLEDTTVMVLRRRAMPTEVVAAADELADLLGLKQGAKEYTVAYGEVARSDTEMAMLTRSMMAIMVELASQVDVPPEHISEGRAAPPLIQGNDVAQDDRRRLITVKHDLEKPEHALTAVRYRDYWYWIDDRDLKSKRTFAYLMILFSLTESGGREGLPLVTIPAG